MTSARLLSGVKLNASKIKTLIVSRSCTKHPQSPILTVPVGGTVLKESDNLDILGMTFDSNMTFEKHLCCFQSSFSKAWLLNWYTRYSLEDKSSVIIDCVCLVC